MASFSRREFLRITVVTAAIGPLPACSSDEKHGISDSQTDQRRVYPQGVASGDPKPNSVIVWTRIETTDQSVNVSYEIAEDQAFTKVVARGDYAADASSDHTVKLKVENLTPATKYYYRFTALDVHSVTGETKTAPEAGSDVPVRFAFATCQDFVGRQYHSWRALLEETQNASVDFVVYLGDYIYETTGDPSFQTPTADRTIVLPDGKPLNAAQVDGGADAGTDEGLFAYSLDDYRALYKQYRSDQYLQEVHRRYPFIIIWDDHEFGDDCWGDHTTHYSELFGPEEEPDQRVAADRAWFEFQPAEVEYHDGAAFPNDIKIYRNLRYGKHLELFMTDERYYRDDHVIPEGPSDPTLNKYIANSAIGSRIFVVKSTFDLRETQVKPTMLGTTQKQWLLDSVHASDATWKIWGSEVQCAQMMVDFSQLQTSLPDFYKTRVYLTVDQWDGYRTERAEILSALADVQNMVVIVGDIHASYASHLYADFDAPAEPPAAVEYTIAGISSYAIAPAAGDTISHNSLLSGFGLQDLVPQWDTLLRQANPHYKYGNSFANGVAIADLDASRIEVTYVHVSDPREPTYEILERKKFRTVAGTKAVELL